MRAYQKRFPGMSVDEMMKEFSGGTFEEFVDSVWVKKPLSSPLEMMYVAGTLRSADEHPRVMPRDVVSTSYADLVSDEMADLLGRNYFGAPSFVYVKRPPMDTQNVVCSTLEYIRVHDFAKKCIDNQQESSALLKRYLPMDNNAMNCFVKRLMDLTGDALEKTNYLKAYQLGMYMADLFMRYDDDLYREDIKPKSFSSYTRGRTICFHLMRRQSYLSLHLEENSSKVGRETKLRYFTEMLRESDFVLHSGVMDLVADGDEEKISNVRIALRIYLEVVFYVTEVGYRREFNNRDGPMNMEDLQKTFDKMWLVPLVSRQLFIETAGWFQQLRKGRIALHGGSSGKRNNRSKRESVMIYQRYKDLQFRAFDLGLPPNRLLKSIPSREEVLKANIVEGSCVCYICSMSVELKNAVRCGRCLARAYCSEKCKNEHASVLHQRECVPLRSARYGDCLRLELTFDMKQAEEMLSSRLLNGWSVVDFLSHFNPEGLAVIERSYRDAPPPYVKVIDPDLNLGDETMLLYEYQKRCYMKTPAYEREQRKYTTSDLYFDFRSCVDIKTSLPILNRSIFNILESEKTVARLPKHMKKQLLFLFEEKVNAVMNHLTMHCLTEGGLDQPVLGELLQDIEFMLSCDALRGCCAGATLEAIERTYFQAEKMLDEEVKILSNDTVELDELTDFISSSYQCSDMDLQFLPKVNFHRASSEDATGNADSPVGDPCEGTSRLIQQNMSPTSAEEELVVDAFGQVALNAGENETSSSTTCPRTSHHGVEESWLHGTEAFGEAAVRQRRQTNRVNRGRRSRREGRERAFRIVEASGEREDGQAVANSESEGPVGEATFIPCRELKESKLCSFEDDCCILCCELWYHFPVSTLAVIFPCGHAMCTLCLLKHDEASKTQEVKSALLMCHLCRSAIPSDVVDRLCVGLVNQQLTKQCSLITKGKDKLFTSEEEGKKYLEGLVRSSRLNCDLVCDIVYDLLASATYGGEGDLTHEQKQAIYEKAQVPLQHLKKEKETLARRKTHLENNAQFGTRKYEMLLSRYTSVCDKLRIAYNSAADDIFERINSGSSSMGHTDDRPSSSSSKAVVKGVLQIDLHGLKAEQALHKLEELVKPVIPVLRRVIVITGRGLHSATSGVSVVKEAVFQFCRFHNSRVAAWVAGRDRNEEVEGASWSGSTSFGVTSTLGSVALFDFTLSCNEVAGNEGAVELTCHVLDEQGKSSYKKKVRRYRNQQRE